MALIIQNGVNLWQLYTLFPTNHLSETLLSSDRQPEMNGLVLQEPKSSLSQKLTLPNTTGRLESGSVGVTKLLWLQSVALISDSVGLEVTFRFPGHGRIIDRTLCSNGIAMAITIDTHLFPRSTGPSLCGTLGSGAADPCNFVTTTGEVCGSSTAGSSWNSFSAQGFPSEQQGRLDLHSREDLTVNSATSGFLFDDTKLARPSHLMSLS